MRGRDGRTGELFSYVDLEVRGRSAHPLQTIQEIAHQALVWRQQEAGCVKARFRGVERVELAFTFAAAAHHLVRLPELLPESR